MKVILPIIFALVLVVGYVSNFVGFVKCDFEPSYKAEIIRGIGIFVPPIGAMAGYIAIEDGDDEKEK